MWITCPFPTATLQEMVGEIEAELERSRAELDSVPKAVARMAPSVAPKKPTKLPTPKTNTRDETNDDKNEEACSSFFFTKNTCSWNMLP